LVVEPFSRTALVQEKAVLENGFTGCSRLRLAFWLRVTALRDKLANTTFGFTKRAEDRFWSSARNLFVMIS